MALNPKIGNLDSPNFDLKFSLSQPETLNLKGFDSLISETGVDLAKLLIKETRKENGALKIEKSRSDKLSVLLKNIQQHLDNIQTSKDVIRENELKIREGKSNLIPLSVNQKKSLQEVYEIYYVLSKKRKVFLNQLKSLETKDLFNEQVLNEDVKTSTIQENLKKIGWMSERISLKNKDSKKRDFGWGAWEENPFRSFFDNRRQFISSVQKVDRFSEALRKKSVSNVEGQRVWAAAAGIGAMEYLYREEDILSEKATGAKTEIEMTVAKKLLKLMNL